MDASWIRKIGSEEKTIYDLRFSDQEQNLHPISISH